MILVFAGVSGAGKSYVAEELARRTGRQRVGFGDYVRYKAELESIPLEYSALQELGHSLVSSGPKQFMQDVLKHGELDIREDLLIDGLRHSTVLDALRDIAAPQKVLLIFVETCDEIIASRLVDRGMKNSKSGLGPVDLQVQKGLRSCADLVIDGAHGIEENIALINEAERRH